MTLHCNLNYSTKSSTRPYVMRAATLRSTRFDFQLLLDNIYVYVYVYNRLQSRDSSVGIATGYWLDDRSRSSSLGMVKNFLFSTSSRPALGSTRTRIQWVPEALSPRVKLSGCEAYHLPPTSAEIKKNVDLYIHSSIRLHGVVLN
jgi:hypothetical protein